MEANHVAESTVSEPIASISTLPVNEKDENKTKTSGQEVPLGQHLYAEFVGKHLKRSQYSKLSQPSITVDALEFIIPIRDFK
ncbi:hypothetical protein TNIN_5841 [Trichonephila inaurata madagascariensis]|uniref:Uncharacterized protein n=1 Tax=Trichonephila inaurata madagascariensis TaxID=2747483 RepID=A0A8X6KQ57_9ARAC|nr:hypothetical protein TNIN_5841 [Trichonephila inaurata madagascariensis]